MGFPFLDAAGAASSLIGGIFKGIQGHKQQKMADAIHPVNAVYNVSPYAQNQLAMVQQMMNGRMAGASSEEQNIAGNFANSMAGVDRNSTNGSQSLALLAGLNGNANIAYSQLGTQEAMNKQGLLGYLNAANQGMTQENQNVYYDQLRNYNNDLNAKNALQNAAWNNKGGMIDSFSNALVGAGNMAQNGAFGSGGGNNTALRGNTIVPGNSIPQVPIYVQSGQLNGGSYINPFMVNPQQNYTNPFIR
jgi:hypothetical protein